MVQFQDDSRQLTRGRLKFEGACGQPTGEWLTRRQWPSLWRHIARSMGAVDDSAAGTIGRADSRRLAGSSKTGRCPAVRFEDVSARRNSASLPLTMASRNPPRTFWMPMEIAQVPATAGSTLAIGAR